MRITATLTAVVGALAVLTPLSAASASVESDSLATYDAELDARGVSTCGTTHRKHHHKKKKGKKDTKTKANYLQAQINAAPKPKQHKHKKISSARPSHYYPAGSQKTTQGSSAPQQAATPTASAGGSNTGSSSGSTSTSMSGFEKTMLDMHNADRALHSAAPLSWSPTLAAAAAQWAAGCKWQHTPNNPYGQNIAAGTASTFGAKDSCTMWYDEIAKYNFASGLYSDATGHFTQMVWKGSKQLGCAIQECSAAQMGLGSSGSARYVVCNYDPPGNVIGQFLQNVLSG